MKGRINYNHCLMLLSIHLDCFELIGRGGLFNKSPWCLQIYHMAFVLFRKSFSHNTAVYLLLYCFLSPLNLPFIHTDPSFVSSPSIFHSRVSHARVCLLTPFTLRTISGETNQQ